MTVSTHLAPWGHYAILDCSECNLASIQSEETLRTWITEVLVAIEMEAIGGPIIARTGVDQADKEGFTLVQIIETGSIVAHFIDRDRHIYVDVFSCKEFTPEVVETCLKKHFGASIAVNKLMIPRNAAARAPE